MTHQTSLTHHSEALLEVMDSYLTHVQLFIPKEIEKYNPEDIPQLVEIYTHVIMNVLERLFLLTKVHKLLFWM